MKTANLTIVIVDIKNFTPRTSKQSREANSELLSRFAGLVKPIVKTFGGKVIKSMGDAFLLTFQSPTDSLHCAMAMQDRLAQLNQQGKEDEAFQVRVAVNVGEVRLDAGDIFGEAVNISARIEGLAGGGEIWFSDAVFLAMNKSEVPYVKLGRRKLKGIPRSVLLYRVPLVHEVGDYRVTGSARLSVKGRRRHKLAPDALPYGGFALERLGGRGVMERFRRSRPYRLTVYACILLVLALGCWAGYLRFQKSHRDAVLKEAARIAAERAQKERFHWPWERKR